MSRLWNRLGDVADVGLGFKSLQNDFFYLSASEVNTYKIEPRYLRRIYLIEDTEARRYLQPRKSTYRLFWCKDETAELRGTGALKYILRKARSPAKQKKQSGKAMTIQEVLEEQGGGTWYAPKAAFHPCRVWLRKAFGSNFSPFIYSEPVVFDQRCNYIQQKESVDEDVLIAYLVSSLFTLALESEGVSSMGGGALEVATKLLRQVPVPDFLSLTSRQVERIKVNAQKVLDSGRTVDWSKEETPMGVARDLDSVWLECVSGDVLLDDLYRDIRKTCMSRLTQAEQRYVVRKETTGKSVDRVVQGIADAVLPLLNARIFPESFVVGSNKAIRLELGKGDLHVTVNLFLDKSHIQIRNSKGDSLFQKDLPTPVTDVLCKALMLGRRTVSIPSERPEAQSALEEFDKWFAQIRERIDKSLEDSSLGTGFEASLSAKICKALGIHPGLMDRKSPTTLILQHSSKM